MWALFAAKVSQMEGQRPPLLATPCSAATVGAPSGWVCLSQP